MSYRKLLSCLLLAAVCFTAESYAAPSRRKNKSTRTAAAKVKTDKFITVTVTGSGETLEQAQQNAKKNALTEVVGRAIKEKTNLLEDGDNVEIKSEYIAASAGLISRYQELSQKKENGIFVVKAEVTVFREQLLEAVVFGVEKPSPVNVKVGSDFEQAREDMTKYLVSYFIDYCRIWSIQVKEIIPEYTKDGKPVLYVNCYLGTTPQRHTLYHNRLAKALAKVGFKRAKYSHDLERKYCPVKILIRPDKVTSRWYDRNSYAWYWGDPKFMEPLKVYEEEWNKYAYKVTFEFLSEDDEVIATHEFGRGFSSFYNNVPAPEWREGYTLRPLVGKDGGASAAYRRKFYLVFSDFADASEMLKVKKVQAKIEPVKIVREKALTVHFSWPGEIKLGQWFEH